MFLNKLNIISSIASSNLELWRGLTIKPAEIKPEKTLELYDIEGCPYCRLVRETLTQLDLDAVIYPCPRGGQRFRAIVEQLGGKLQFPFLVDANTGINMYESYDIISYLMTTYGKRPAPSFLKVKFFDTISSIASGMPRLTNGSTYRKAKTPEKLLELYSFESSPFSRVVRELLCEMQIPYRLHNVGKGEWRDMVIPVVREAIMPDFSPTTEKRAKFHARAGKVQVPYLVDDNNNIAIFESEKIKQYLLKTYAL
ncbi:MAG: glutathione S-transferase N-terminal domain-containing protein [Litorilituus sp.]|jgi:glutathione S-transferase|nr:glutathione S-transferase N-terminal domain-containing protein [Litorilituus sp.]